jgi:hypothetical protein
MLTDQIGPATPAPSGPPAGERMYYDETPREAPATAANPTVPPFILLNDATIHLKLTKSIPPTPPTSTIPSSWNPR